MSIKSTLALLSIIAAVGAASPASAQSFSHSTGTGNVLPFSYPAASENGNAVRENSRGTYAMAPRSQFNRQIAVPSETGSAGYNELLMTH